VKFSVLVSTRGHIPSLGRESRKRNRPCTKKKTRLLLRGRKKIKNNCYGKAENLATWAPFTKNVGREEKGKVIRSSVQAARGEAERKG